MAQLYGKAIASVLGVRRSVFGISPPAQAVEQRTSTCDDHFKWRRSDSCADRKLLDRCLQRLEHVHETASELHGDIHCYNRQHQADHQFHAYGELGHAHDPVARSECTAKKLSLLKSTR